MLVAIAALVLGAIAITRGLGERSEAPRDLDGRPVALEQGEVPAPELRDRMQVVEPAPEASGPRFRVPAAGLDVGIGTLREVDGEITPPGFTTVYRVTNRGTDHTDPTAGRVFIVTHSVRDGRAPGNSLESVPAGTVVEVGRVRYAVTGSERIPKADLAHRQDVWADEPGTLVIITCLQRDRGRSLDNIVITATVADPATG